MLLVTKSLLHNLQSKPRTILVAHQLHSPGNSYSRGYRPVLERSTRTHCTFYHQVAGHSLSQLVQRVATRWLLLCFHHRTFSRCRFQHLRVETIEVQPEIIKLNE